MRLAKLSWRITFAHNPLRKCGEEATFMEYRPATIYPSFEKAKIEALADLFERWAKETDKHPLPKDYLATHLVFDGFYPYYTQQKPRILFIGWEALGISGNHYIDVLMEVYRSKEKLIGKRPINRDKFHSRLLYLAYGIIKGFQSMQFCEWGNIPRASDLTEIMGKEDGFSYAFMNLSKFSNDSDSYRADRDLIDKSLACSKSGSINFISREIELLQPQIVISMNLMENIHLLGDVETVKQDSKVNTHILNAGEWKGILLLDTFHFSARKKGNEDFYMPICEAIQAHANKASALSGVQEMKFSWVKPDRHTLNPSRPEVHP